MLPRRLPGLTAGKYLFMCFELRLHIFHKNQTLIIMGLFSFLKGKGKEVAEPAKTISPAEANIARAEGLRKVVDSYGLDIEDLFIAVNGDKVSVSGKVESQEMREKVILVLGNVQGIASVEDNITVEKPEPEATFYEVKSGDSLSKIAGKVYGDVMKYNTIFEANKPMLKDMNKIYPGQVLRIPPLPEG